MKFKIVLVFICTYMPFFGCRAFLQILSNGNGSSQGQKLLNEIYEYELDPLTLQA